MHLYIVFLFSDSPWSRRIGEKNCGFHNELGHKCDSNNFSVTIEMHGYIKINIISIISIMNSLFVRLLFKSSWVKSISTLRHLLEWMDIERERGWVLCEVKKKYTLMEKFNRSQNDHFACDRIKHKEMHQKTFARQTSSLASLSELTIAAFRRLDRPREKHAAFPTSAFTVRNSKRSTVGILHFQFQFPDHAPSTPAFARSSKNCHMFGSSR